MRKSVKIMIITAAMMVLAMAPVKAVNIVSLMAIADGNTAITPEFYWTYDQKDCQVETFGFEENTEDKWYISWGEYWDSLNTAHVARLENDSQKGNIGAIYHNAGAYKGQNIAIKVTVEDWKELGVGGTDAYGRESYPCAYFYDGYYTGVEFTKEPAVVDPVVKVEFFYEEDATQTPIDIKGFYSILTSDTNEYALDLNVDTVRKIYLTKTSRVFVTEKDNNIHLESRGRFIGDDYQADLSATVAFDTSKTADKAIRYMVTTMGDVDLTTVPENKVFVQATYTPQSIVEFENRDNIFVDKEEVISNDDIQYDILLSRNNDAFILKDAQLVDELDPSLALKKVTILSTHGEDITSEYNISTVNNQVVITKEVESSNIASIISIGCRVTRSVSYNRQLQNTVTLNGQFLANASVNYLAPLSASSVKYNVEAKEMLNISKVENVSLLDEVEAYVEEQQAEDSNAKEEVKEDVEAGEKVEEVTEVKTSTNPNTSDINVCGYIVLALAAAVVTVKTTKKLAR